MKTFGTLESHEHRHPVWPHKFNPYSRNRPTQNLDDRLFNTLINTFPCDAGLSLDHLFIGCIDAPDDIPMGSTECIRTVGGFEREEYNNLPRGTEDWQGRRRAEAEVAVMLKQILKECDE